MSIVLTDVAPRIHYTATAGQTVFQVPFELIDAAHVTVWVNEVECVYDATPADSLSYFLQASPDAPPVEVAGGQLTFGPPGRVAGDEVIIIRDMPIERVIDLPISGVFPVAA